MRIIDADALKEHISKIVEEEGQIDPKWAIGLNYANRIIDNFPSLEPFDSAYQEGYKKSMEKYKRGITQRGNNNEWTGIIKKIR